MYKYTLLQRPYLDWIRRVVQTLTDDKPATDGSAKAPFYYMSSPCFTRLLIKKFKFVKHVYFDFLLH